ncbi:MAG: hydrolase [Nocardioides sp.]|nr:hydrolase [Nocardioides sp.]
MTLRTTLRDDALATLETWRPPTPEQERLRGRFVSHLRDHDDGLRRTCFPDHVTAGTLVVDESAGRVLLNLHGKAQRWFAFGGHCEAGDDTLAGAAAREAREESGIDDLRFDPVPAHLDEHAVGFCDPRGVVRHLDVRYVAVAPTAAVHAVSDESLDVRWWPLDALPELEPEMHELIAVARARFG